jgi:hypothetical protein
MGGTSQLLSFCCSFRNTMHFSVPIATARITWKLYHCFQLAQYMQVGLINCLTFSSLEDSIRINANTSFMIYVKKNSMVWVRNRTIPTERPPPVVEVIANFLRIEGATWSAWRIPTAVFSVFYQVAPQLYSRGWVDPVPYSLLFFSGSAGNRTRAPGSVAKNSDH